MTITFLRNFGLRRRATLGAIVAVVIVGAVVWLTHNSDDDPLFHNVQESIWIKDLGHNDAAEVEEWRKFGDAGVQVLVRGFEHATDRGGRLHRKLHWNAPPWLRGRLPDPQPDRHAETRHRIISLLWSMGEDAQSAAPAMAKLVRDEEDQRVMQSIIGFFVTGEDNCMLNKISASERRQLVPVFIRAMQDPSLQNSRHNASIGLKYFKEDAEKLTPVLVAALTDPTPYVRLYSAEALNCIAPDAAKQNGAMAILVQLVDSPDNQLATKAIRALKYPGTEIETATRTLIGYLESKNTGVACEAVWTLEWAPEEFHRFSHMVIPALRQASGRNDSVGAYAKVALARWEKRKEPAK